MKKKAGFASLILSIILSGCANITPIQKLTLPPVVLIDGTVTSVNNSGFTLQDTSGEIYVKAEPANSARLDIQPKEKIKVYGNLAGGPKRVFDGYVIRKENGEQIKISEPTPHFGLLLQSAF